VSKLIWKTLEMEKGNSLTEWKTCERAKIPGGWLVRYDWWVPSSEGMGASGLTFVPDPHHAWDGSSLE